MKNLRLLVLGGLAAGLGAGTFAYFRAAPRAAEAPSATAGPAEPGAAPNGGASDEVQRLRAELRKRDEMLASLVAKSWQAAADAGASATAARPSAAAHPGDRAVDILDERMFTAPRDPALAAEMERAIREVAGSPAMAQAKIASLHCGSTLCKIILAAEDGGDVNQSMAELGSNPPKMFGATAVHRTSDGQSAMYLARSREDLAMTAQ